MKKLDINDYIGKKFNHLEPISESEIRSPQGTLQWNFRCDCGNIVQAPPSRVLNGSKKSCGCMAKEFWKGKSKEKSLSKYIGKRYGMLTVKGFVIYPDKRPCLLCVCDCGNEKLIKVGVINAKDGPKSCGCKSGNWVHGYSYNRLYKEWELMRSRCYNKNNDSYNRYGGRGTSVCNEWRTSPKEFIKWALSNGYDDNLTLDRIDNNGNYCPENCRWATMYEQSRNRRTNSYFTFNGETMIVPDFAKKYGIKSQTIWSRLRRGKTIEEALTEPVHKKSI